MNLPAVAGAAYARAHHSMWIVDCPAQYCASALQMDPGDTSFACWDCGYTTNAVIWPPNVADIEALLMMRPNFINRNWWPGETLHDLLAENIEHGVVPPQWKQLEAPTPVRVLRIVGDRIVAGQLPSRQRMAVGR